MAGDHPLRAIREIVKAGLAALSPEFERLYVRLGGHRKTVVIGLKMSNFNCCAATL
ncbi:MAG: hypothetical protein JOZ29_14070 [Deltaproteobacteria bacterium]|nr:hypothetical protein [Deltaproteobacteria bacterium]